MCYPFVNKKINGITFSYLMTGLLRPVVFGKLDAKIVLNYFGILSELIKELNIHSNSLN